MVETAVRAAGGVVSRDGRVLLVHRPAHEDWSLPKGKLKRGEHPLLAAVREVREETGVTGQPGPRLPSTRYDVWLGDRALPKVVDYWAMTISNIETFAPNDEVDEIVWLSIPDALQRLSYAHDREVVRAFGELPPVYPPLVLVRHARAGDRRSWSGPDARRPLDADGRRRAAALATLLPLFGPGRLVSAQPLRCRQTLAPAARVLELPVEVDGRFDEEADPAAAEAALRDLVGHKEVSVVCSQGGLIPPLLARLSGRPAAELELRRGAGVVLWFSGDTLVATDPLT